MNKRFANWTQPVIDENGDTKYGWKVIHPEGLLLGKNTDIGWGTLINAKYGVIVGGETQIGPHCTITSESTIRGMKGRIIIGPDCLIGAYTLIMPGVTIAPGSVIRAYSYIDKDV